MSLINDNNIQTIDNFLVENIKNINICNGMIKSLNCLNGGTYENIVVSACLNDTEYRNITAKNFNVSNNLFINLTFINCTIEYLDVSENKLLKLLNFIDCSIYSINASNCCLNFLINIPLSLKYLNVENNNLTVLNITKNNIKCLNVKNNKLPKYIKYDCEKVFYDSDDDEQKDYEDLNNYNELYDNFDDFDDYYNSYLSSNYEEPKINIPIEPIYEKIVLNRYKEI